MRGACAIVSRSPKPAERGPVAAAGLALALLLAGAAAAAPGPTPQLQATEWSFPHSTPVQVVPLPQGGLLVAALTGQIYHYTAAGSATLVTHIEAHPPTGEFGLLGMALHPDYPAEPWVYVYHTDPLTLPKTQSIHRFPWTEDAPAGGLEAIVTTIPANPACCHNGGRIAFGPDGMLHATLGDIMVAPLAQNPLLAPGSVLRYTPEGDVPADNPFWPSPVAMYGLRNPFGLTFDDEWGAVVTDNGPSTFDGPAGLDEVNLLAIGDNAGWPLARGDIEVPATVPPLWHSGSTPVAPTGVVVPRDSAVAAWDGKILWCNYNQNEARLIDPAVPDPQPVVIPDAPCRFDVAQNAAGRLVFATTSALWVIS